MQDSSEVQIGLLLPSKVLPQRPPNLTLPSTRAGGSVIIWLSHNTEHSSSKSGMSMEEQRIRVIDDTCHRITPCSPPRCLPPTSPPRSLPVPPSLPNQVDSMDEPANMVYAPNVDNTTPQPATPTLHTPASASCSSGTPPSSPHPPSTPSLNSPLAAGGDIPTVLVLRQVIEDRRIHSPVSRMRRMDRPPSIAHSTKTVNFARARSVDATAKSHLPQRAQTASSEQEGLPAAHVEHITNSSSGPHLSHQPFSDSNSPLPPTHPSIVHVHSGSGLPPLSPQTPQARSPTNSALSRRPPMLHTQSVPARARHLCMAESSNSPLPSVPPDLVQGHSSYCNMLRSLASPSVSFASPSPSPTSSSAPRSPGRLLQIKPKTPVSKAAAAASQGKVGEKKKTEKNEEEYNWVRGHIAWQASIWSAYNRFCQSFRCCRGNQQKY